MPLWLIDLVNLKSVTIFDVFYLTFFLQKERKMEEVWQRELFCLLVAFQMAATDKFGPGWSQGQGARAWPLTWVAGAHEVLQVFDIFSDMATGSYMRSRIARTTKESHLPSEYLTSSAVAPAWSLFDVSDFCFFYFFVLSIWNNIYYSIFIIFICQGELWITTTSLLTIF